jgi:hypothetical protein
MTFGWLKRRTFSTTSDGNLKYLRIPSFMKETVPEKSVHPEGTTLGPDGELIASALREHTGVTGSKTDVNLRVNELKEELSMAYSV